MRVIAKWAVRAVLAIVVLAAVGWIGVYAASETILRRHYAFTAQPVVATRTAADVAAGAKLTHLFGCQECHGPDLHGAVVFDDPMLARIWAPNLNLAARAYSDAQLAAVIRAGVRPDGRALVFMPCEVLNRLSDVEIAQLIAYLRSLPPRGAAGGETVALGPVGRIGLLAGKFRNAPEMVAAARRRPLPDYGPATASGRAIARACTGCHGPDLTGQDGPDLRIAAAYDAPSFVRLLRRGIALDGAPVKPIGAIGDDGSGSMMAQAAPLLSRDLTDADIAALHAYLVTRVERLPLFPGRRRP